jgi:hypothetical protein
MTKQRRNKSSVPSVSIDDLASGLITKSEIVETPVKAVEAVEEMVAEAPIEAVEEAPIEAVEEAPIEAVEEAAEDTLPPIKMTLRAWQRLVKPEEELIVNASSPVNQDSWLPWPIGMTYTFSDYNGPLQATMIGQHDKTVLCAFLTATDKRRLVRNRESFAQTLAANGIPNEYNSSAGTRYYFSLPTYKFVICPEGNGIDTHRLYEALMAGCIPIVERRPHIADKYKGCPILFTTDYSEINELYLREKYREMIDKEWDFSALYLSTYSDEEQAAIKANSDYWCRTFRVRKWY